MAQSATTTPLTYNGGEVNAYLGGNADFPAEFVGTRLCEGGRSGPDSNTGCLLLNRGGNGTWENDAGPGRRQPPAAVNWYVVADQQGTVTRVSTEDRDTYFVIFEFTQQYYSFAPRHLMAFPASIIKGSPRRIIIQSKYRDVN